MTFAYDAPTTNAAESHPTRSDALAPAMHIEETPCMVIPAVSVTPAVNVKLWQARTARTWMTWT